LTWRRNGATELKNHQPNGLEKETEYRVPHLLAAQVTDKITFVSVLRVTVRDLLSLVRETIRAVLALIRQRIFFGRMLIQVFFQLKIGLEAFAAEFAGEHELLVLYQRQVQSQSKALAQFCGRILLLIREQCVYGRGRLLLV
jgi:hypothetical protein